jgi:hypothetical protein
MQLKPVIFVAAIFATTVFGGSIAVQNASFETLPAAGLLLTCGTNCFYGLGSIPGWDAAAPGEIAGEFQPGPPSTTTYFNYVPDGVTVAYTNSGYIAQTVSETVVGGAKYTLQVDVGTNHQYPASPVILLIIGGLNSYQAFHAQAPLGDWVTYSVSYTAPSFDQGKSIRIYIEGTSAQTDIDNVRLDDDIDGNVGPAGPQAGVPEPSTWALMGLGLIPFLMRSQGRFASRARLGALLRRRQPRRLEC